MKAMILAAGLGTRLAPYTDHTPKPLFTINRRAVLDITIEQLLKAGCRQIMINTHHLHERIAEHVNSRSYGLSVTIRHEPEILGTGGGIANVADWWRQGPLLVVNGDIVCNIDLAEVAAFHRRHHCPVTMVMHDCAEFNAVSVNRNGYVVSFDMPTPGTDTHLMAFTGIHVLETEVLQHLPSKGFADIISAYRDLLAGNRPIKAMVPQDHYWNDIGTPRRYREASLDHMVPEAFAAAFGHRPTTPIRIRPLHGDGSDRRWFRLQAGSDQLILADHGIRNAPPPQEADAYVAIGSHLLQQGIAVPRIFLADTFCGLVFVEDLGDTHLQTVLPRQAPLAKAALYQRVIDQWAVMAVEACKGFESAWTHQSAEYDRALILEKEARYFTEAYLRNYVHWDISFDELATEFAQLADGALNHAVSGFIHRDFQSRNIMIHKGEVYFIDFQGGRTGPVQYDLAALLIDPYASLPADLQDHLAAYGASALKQRYGIDQNRFLRGYAFCAVTRNLQILGAFAFLSRAKGKTAFEAYIPCAVQRLRDNLRKIPTGALPRLLGIADRLVRQQVSASPGKETPHGAH